MFTERREDRYNVTTGLSDSARPADAKYQPRKRGPLHHTERRSADTGYGVMNHASESERTRATTADRERHYAEQVSRVAPAIRGSNYGPERHYE